MSLDRACQIFSDDRNSVVLKEGKSRFEGDNPEQKKVQAYRVDGCLITTNTPKCDFLLLIQTEKAVFIECKGRDIDWACAQIIASAKALREKIGDLPWYARIVSSRGRNPKARTTNEKKLQKLLRSVNGFWAPSLLQIGTGGRLRERL